MNRQYYLDLAASGARFPIGTHLTLHRKSDHAERLYNGEKLGEVLAEAARSYKSPMGIPLMDLTLEKEALLAILGVPADQREKFHFSKPPAPGSLDKVKTVPFIIPRMQATCDAISYIAQKTDLIPLGMGIGPFSLVTKLLTDPITAVFLAGSGMTGEDEPDVELLEQSIDLALELILRYFKAQAVAGAKGIIVCEPAANLVYFSPKQMEEGSDVFERFVLKPNLKIKEMLKNLNVDLIFHDCGELTDGMVASFNQLDPAILSLGSSRVLWKDAAIVQKQTVLYGNLPSKKFYSDESISVNTVKSMTRELISKMKEVGHPFIMGSECDVLCVHGKEDIIESKVKAMMEA